VHYLKETLDHDMNIQSVLIKGEVSNFTNHRSGHWYFTLKDAKAKLNCVMFASYASRCRILLKEGMKIIVKASLSVYEPQGNVQLYVTALQVDGLGDLYLQLEQLKKKLYQEGLFDPAHKKALPLYPEHIVLITAKEGAALQDMLRTLNRRWPLVEIAVLPSLVQGKEAAANLIEAIKKADALHPDVILLARGGGSIEDLWCFNDEALARCIYACESVIVSGVGHEVDTTLVDYVSDTRAATPTAAAELVTPDIMEVQQLLVKQQRALQQSMQMRLDEANNRLTHAATHRYLKNPLLYVQDAQMKLAMLSKEMEKVNVQMDQARARFMHLSQRFLYCSEQKKTRLREQIAMQKEQLVHAQNEYITKRSERLATQTSLLDAYSPLKILSRGYAVLYAERHIAKSIRDIAVDSEIQVRMQDGILHAAVKQKEEF